MTTGFDNTPNIGQQLTDNIVGGNIGGIISTRPVAKYASGARTILKINNRAVGFAFGVSWRVDTLYTEINTIDNPLPEEFVPKAIKVTGSISTLHIPGQGAGIQLWQPDVLAFLFHQYLTIEVRDSATDALLFFAPKAVINSRQEDIRVDELAQVTLNFMAIGFKDEKEPAYPDKFDAQGASSGSTEGDIHNESVNPVNPSSGFKESAVGK